MNNTYRILIPISGIIVLLAILVGVIWLGTEIQSIHYTNQISHNHWVSEEKEAVENLHLYLLSGDSTYYKEYKKDFNILRRRVEWGEMILDPSVAEEKVINLLSERTNQNRWQIRKSILVNRKLRFFEPIEEVIQRSQRLTATLSELDSLETLVQTSFSNRAESSMKKTKLGDRFRQLMVRIEREAARLNNQYGQASQWMQRWIVRGTILLSSVLLFISIAVILVMNRKQRNSELQLIENQQELQETVKDRDVLIQEIHHRVKNNLAIISGLLFMQLETSNDPATIDYLQNALNRIQSMALVHEQLYRQTESDAHIDMESYLPKLTQSIQETSGAAQKKVEINVNASHITLPLTKAVPIGLLTTELMMNVFKHAFKNDSEKRINVSLTHSNEHCILIIEDNGVGLPDDFSLDSDSLGINIINNLVQQIEGDIRYESKPGEGTKFTITF